MSSDKTDLLISRRNKKRKIFFAVLIVFELVLGITYFYNVSRPHTWIPFLSFQYALCLLLLLQSGLFLWILEFDVRWRELIFFLVPPNLYVVTSVVLLSSVRSVVVTLLLLILLAVGYYILLAAINIVNVSTIRPVPLKKAALSSLFFIGMVMSFLLGWNVLQVRVGQDIWVQGWIWGALTGFGASFLFMAAEDGKFHFVETLLLGWIALQLLTLINFWNVNSLVAALTVVGWTFVVLGLLNHVVNRSLTVNMKREYLLFSILLLGVFFWL